MLENSKQIGFKLGLTQFADLSFNEFYSKYLNTNKYISYSTDDKILTNDGEVFKDTKDWSSLFSYIKDQRECGSCWAFSTIGVVEAFTIIRGRNLKLSEQQLIDCDLQSDGCFGAQFKNSYNYLINNPLVSENDYPYDPNYKNDEIRHICNIQSIKPIVKINSFDYCKGRKCTIAKINEFLERGPYSSFIDYNQPNIHLYREGVFDLLVCKVANHGIIVLYHDYNNKIIKIRNSYGDTWGNNGIGIFSYNNTIGTRGCGMLEEAYQPLELTYLR